LNKDSISVLVDCVSNGGVGGGGNGCGCGCGSDRSKTEECIHQICRTENLINQHSQLNVHKSLGIFI
jgi:hypothetical protein